MNLLTEEKDLETTIVSEPSPALGTTLPAVGGSPKTSTVTGPSAAVIGFFPRTPPDPNLLPSGYDGWAQAHPLQQVRWTRTVAMLKLHASGNDAPPNLLGDYGGFQGVVLSHEFRVAVSVHGVSVTWDDATGTVDFQRRMDIEEGYTPINTWQFVPPNWRHQNHGYHKGAKRFGATIASTSTSATLTVTARVKLWWGYNVLQSFATFHLAPWAIVQIKYTVYRSGHVEILFAGSKIPSQFNYVNWSLHSKFDMNTNAVAAVDAFLTSGNCRDSPVFVVSDFPP
jgi:hypothetical protein